MANERNLADPDFEPTDEDLIGLSERAFAGIRAERQLALEQLRARIAAARQQVLRELDAGAFGSRRGA